MVKVPVLKKKDSNIYPNWVVSTLQAGSHWLPAFFVIPIINLILICIGGSLTLHTKFIFMGGLGFQELLVIGLVVLVLFGGKKIPEFMRGLGKGIREFNDAKDNVKREIEEGIKEKDKTTTGA